MLRENIIVFILCICCFSYLYAYESNEKEYKNEDLNNNIYYTGRVKISSGSKQYHTVWEIKSNSVKYERQIVVVKCVEKTKVYTDFKKNAKDDYTQYVVNPHCEFFANGKVDDKWIYIKLLEGEWRWISIDKIDFVTGSLQELPELKFYKSYNDGFTKIVFYGNIIHIWGIDGFDNFSTNNIISEILPLKRNIENKLNYISFNNKKYLIIVNNNFLSLINDRNKEIYYGVDGISVRRKELFGHSMPDIFSASSELEEKGILYSAKNLDNQNGNLPWIESVAGDGIGEYININYNQIGAIIISNGYIHFNKPFLYENNNRVKVFEVYNQDGKKIQEIKLKDTSNPQVFKIAEKCKSIKLIIKEVYKGNKYNNTCVNYIKIIPDFCPLDGFVLNN